MANLGYIQIIRQCNQRCLFCSNPENQRVLPLVEAIAKIQELKEAGFAGVILTGGEPTLHPGLPAMLRAAKEMGIPARLISNGQRLAEPGYLEGLVAAGLEHLHLSIHSMRAPVQALLTQNPGSLERLEEGLSLAGRLGVNCDVNMVLCAQNIDHLEESVGLLIERYPFVRHFVFNNLDPRMNRVQENPHTVARLRQIELPLHRALARILSSSRTARVERVPLCAMVEHAWLSTETRKIVLQEERRVHFLDDKGEVRQREFFHDKAGCCEVCRYDPICAGLYDLGGAFNAKELSPVFLDPEPVAAAVRAGQ